MTRYRVEGLSWLALRTFVHTRNTVFFLPGGFVGVPLGVLYFGKISSSITSSTVASESAESSWVFWDAWDLSSDVTCFSQREGTATECWLKLDGWISLHRYFSAQLKNVMLIWWCRYCSCLLLRCGRSSFYRLSWPDRLRRNILLIFWIIHCQRCNFFMNDCERSSFGSVDFSNVVFDTSKRVTDASFWKWLFTFTRKWNSLLLECEDRILGQKMRWS